MRILISLILIVSLAGSASALQPGSRDVLYCQDADFPKSLEPNDTGHEVADDIPDVLAGQYISAVTF